MEQPLFFPTALAPVNVLDKGRMPLLSESDERVMRRKQANRDSARRSKIRKKQEVEALEGQAKQLQTEHAALKLKVTKAQQRVANLRHVNSMLTAQAKEEGCEIK